MQRHRKTISQTNIRRGQNPQNQPKTLHLTTGQTDGRTENDDDDGRTWTDGQRTVDDDGTDGRTEDDDDGTRRDTTGRMEKGHSFIYIGTKFLMPQ